MAKEFGENERRICAYFQKDIMFYYNGSEYIVLENAAKPTCDRGEPKTDIYVKAKNRLEGYVKEFKISYKQDNADFIENKTSAERAEKLLGDDWQNIIIESTSKLKSEFENRVLIYKEKLGRVDKGAITLGWKFEILRVKSGELSNKLNLTEDQKRDIYAGTNLPDSKRNATVNGKTIEYSGIANFIFEEVVPAKNAQDVIDGLKTIDEYLQIYPDLYFSCKALNYRTFRKKYDGNRPLSVFVDWTVTDGKLDYQLIYDRPLITRGDEVFERLKSALIKLGVENTDNLDDDMVVNKKIIYK